MRIIQKIWRIVYFHLQQLSAQSLENFLIGCATQDICATYHAHSVHVKHKHIVWLMNFNLFFSTHGLFEEWPNCGACKESVKHALSECTSYNSQTQNFFDYLKQVLTPEAFKTFRHSSICNKDMFCLGEK